MAWTSNPYYKNWKQKDLYKTYYLVDLKQKRIINKTTMRVDTIQFNNGKIAARGLKYMVWCNAAQYAKGEKI